MVITNRAYVLYTEGIHVIIQGDSLLTHSVSYSVSHCFPVPQPTVQKSTSIKSITHAHGRYPLITDAVFIHNGHEYPVNATDKSGVRLDILQPIVDELDVIQSIYSRVHFARFDLHLPKGTSVETGNEWASQLFKKLRERLQSRYKRPKGVTSPIKDFAYGWVRERERAKQDHYHCWIALPQRQVQRLGRRTYGVASAIIDIWCDLTGGEHTLVNLPRKDDIYPPDYVIERDKPETLKGPIYWASYLAKERGKYQTGEGARTHSTSLLRNRKR